MCFDFKTLIDIQSKRYRYWNDKATIEQIEKYIKDEGLDNWHHVSGFDHPKIMIYTNEKPKQPTLSQWGLVPFWVKDREQQGKIWNQTINARGETIFEKPSFRGSAKSKRCLVYVNGFYEHHHFKGKTYPFYIFNKDESPMILAGLWSDWTDKETGEIINTFSIVTTKGNTLLSKIHNNPKLKEPRMPVILDEAYADKWLEPINNDSDRQKIISLINPYPDSQLKAHTVNKLRGKEAIGNVPEASKEFIYPGLKIA